MQRWSCAAIVATLAGPGAMAHHSLSRNFDAGRQVTVTGVISEFRFVQPHSHIVLDAAFGGSEPALWWLEMDNYWELVQIGITADTFRPGDRVVAMGSPARGEEPRIYLRQLDRPADGLRYQQIGYRPSMTVVREGSAP
ncbi:MAG TPA: DUF6152 family protein [Gammaproteobacteria bacterium]|nr:DUF6152 family protein [Gammaproteobacteria bacterium]